MVEAGHRNRWKGVRAVERDEGLEWFRGPGAGATDEFFKHHRWIVEPHAVIECVGVFTATMLQHVVVKKSHAIHLTLV